MLILLAALVAIATCGGGGGRLLRRRDADRAAAACHAKEAYDAMEWPIIVMLGCLIPVGEALKDTGAAGLMADVLTVLAAQFRPISRSVSSWWCRCW